MGAYRGCNPPIQTIDPNDINFSRSGPREIPEPIDIFLNVAHNAQHVSNEKYGPLVVCWVYKGWNPTQLYGDYFINQYKDPGK